MKSQSRSWCESQTFRLKICSRHRRRRRQIRYLRIHLIHPHRRPRVRRRLHRLRYLRRLIIYRLVLTSIQLNIHCRC